MKILAVTFSSGLKGGANRSFLMVVERLKNRFNCEITVIVPDEGDLTEELDKNKIPWYCANYKSVGIIKKFNVKECLRTAKNISNYIYDHFAVKRVIKELNCEQFDVIYINDNATYFGAIMANKMQLPYVWHFRSVLAEHSHFVPGAKKIIENASAIIAISNDMKKQYEQSIAHDNLVVILNGIPDQHESKSDNWKDYGVELIQCGRIAEDKCQIDAIRAVEQLKNNGYKVHLRIVGMPHGKPGNRYYKKLENYIQINGLDDLISFEGQVENVAKLREKANIELICTKREPFGRVTVEGMRSGLVVIGAESGGTKEIIRNMENGLLYRQGDVYDLAEKIRLVLDNPELAQKLSDGAYSYSHSHFTPDENASLIYEVLEATISSGENSES